MGGEVFGPLQSEGWKRGPGGVALPDKWGCSPGQGAVAWDLARVVRVQKMRSCR